MSLGLSRGKSVLVVDDDEATREAFASALKGEGYAVTTAHNGLEALGYLRAGREPDLILLDLSMPVMTGWEFRQQQLRDPVLAHIPVLIISAESQVVDRANELGDVGYLAKPVEPDLLMASISRFTLGYKPGILVVEEEPGVRTMLDVALRHHGFQVRLASSSEEAIELFRKYHASIAVVLLEVHLSPLDGPGTLAVLRTIKPDVCCCFMCSSAPGYHVDQLIGMGASNVFLKPLGNWSQLVRSLWDLALIAAPVE